MAEVFFVRHGQASFDQENYDQLSATGIQQARWLGEYFAARDLHFDRLISGDLRRHQETAEQILATLTQPELPRLETQKFCNEFDFKAIVSCFLKQFPEQEIQQPGSQKAYFALLKSALQAWQREELVGHLPESWRDFTARIQQMLDYLKTHAASEKVLVVSSGGPISMALSLILQAPADTMLSLNMQTKNSAFSHCFYNKHGFQLSQFNAVPHLDSPSRQNQQTYV